MTLTVPALDDGVVRLRPPEPGDVDTIFATIQDPEIPRFTTIPWPYERIHALNYVKESARTWREGVAASFVMIDSSTDEVIGSIALVELDREAAHAEVGYWVARGVRGRGVATRALRLIARWALRDLGVARLELQADVRNHASHRVAEKAGFTREGEVDPPPRCRERSDRMVMFSLTPADLEE
jgi:RimJ/RimL family protein N-acetyltransferase